MFQGRRIIQSSVSAAALMRLRNHAARCDVIGGSLDDYRTLIHDVLVRCPVYFTCYTKQTNQKVVKVSRSNLRAVMEF